MRETWRPVVGFEGVYEISNLGNLVRVASCTGKPCRKPVKKELRKGYRSFTLSMSGKAKHFSAHRLVWEAFVGPIPIGMQLNHKDGDKDNPDLTNLEVVTASENKIHAIHVLGKWPTLPPSGVGESNGHARLTEADVAEIRALVGSGLTQTETARRFNVTQSHVSSIILGKSWGHT